MMGSVMLLVVFLHVSFATGQAARANSGWCREQEGAEIKSWLVLHRMGDKVKLLSLAARNED